MRRLAGGIPRGLKSHRTAEGVEYGRYARGILKRLTERGLSLGPEAMPILREAALTVVDLRRVRADLEAVRGRKKRQELRRLSREQGRLRLTLLALERHLEVAARNGDGRPLDLKAALAAQRTAP